MLIKKLALTALAVSAIAAPLSATAQDFGPGRGPAVHSEAYRGFDHGPLVQVGWRRPYYGQRDYGYGFRPYHHHYWHRGFYGYGWRR